MDTVNKKLRIIGNENTVDVCGSFIVIWGLESMTVGNAQLTS
jgi:hypothetical protein